MSQKTHLLVLDSRDRLNYPVSSTHDCQLRIRPAIAGFNKVELLSFQLVLSHYNVKSNINRISFTVGSTNYTIQIPPTSYTPCTLTAMMKRLMEEASGETFDIFYDTGLFRFVWTITSAPTFFFAWNGLVDSMADLLGFKNQANTSASQTIQSIEAVNLNLPSYFYIQIPEFNIHVRSSHENDYATFVIMNTGNGGDVMTHQQFLSYQILEYFQASSLSSVNVRIKGRNNEDIDLNNSNWTMILRLHYPDSVDGVGV